MNKDQQSELELSFIESIRAIDGDDAADNTTASYASGWWTIESVDGAIDRFRTSTLEGRVDNMRQTIAAMEKSAEIAANPAPAQAPTPGPAIAPVPFVPAPTPTSVSEPFGFLTWWTIHQGLHSVENLQSAASAASVPEWVVGAMAGAKPESAWLRATQVGAKGRPSSTNGDSNLTARFLVRDAGDASDRVRLLIRETVDENNLTVSVEDVGILTWNLNKGVVWEPDASYDRDWTEVEKLIDRMRESYAKRVGKVDDGRLRNIIFRWLETRHRVCVRGTGGVYFIPNPGDEWERDELLTEVASIRNWITGAGAGTFTVVAAYPGGMTTVDDFRQSANDDLEAEVKTIMAKLDQWDKNERMNAGSKMFSAGTQLEVLDQLGEKLQLLEDSLETKLGTASAMMEIARNRAFEMHNANNAVVESARKKRRDAKDEERAARKSAREDAKAEKAKKSGTAKDRATKTAL